MPQFRKSTTVKIGTESVELSTGTVAWLVDKLGNTTLGDIEDAPTVDALHLRKLWKALDKEADTLTL